MTADPLPVLHLARWTVTSGSNIQSRGAVVLAAGDLQLEASAEGNGPIDALYNAVDRAVAEVLAGHPRLLAYDIHALAEGPDAEGEVRIRLAPPPEAEGARSSGRYVGTARSTNIVAASIEAYIDALNQLLAEAHWAGATEAAGDRRPARSVAAAKARRAELDEEQGAHDTTAWFER
jgi:2-isopropylmalate synthase